VPIGTQLPNRPRNRRGINAIAQMPNRPTVNTKAS
jgi:hypothetical protein